MSDIWNWPELAGKTIKDAGYRLREGRRPVIWIKLRFTDGTGLVMGDADAWNVQAPDLYAYVYGDDKWESVMDMHTRTHEETDDET